MGYRLDVIGNKTKKNYYGTKLYGYVNEEELKSYKYLVGIKKLAGNEYFTYGEGIETILNKDEFKEFIKFYNEDLNNDRYKGTEYEDWFINTNEIQELLNSDEDKIISWG